MAGEANKAAQARTPAFGDVYASIRDFENAIFAYVLPDNHQYCKKSKTQEYDKILCRRWNEAGINCTAGFQVAKRHKDEGPGWRLCSAQKYHAATCEAKSLVVASTVNPLPTPPNSNEPSSSSPVPSTSSIPLSVVSHRSFGGKGRQFTLPDTSHVQKTARPITSVREASDITQSSETSVVNALIPKHEDHEFDFSASERLPKVEAEALLPLTLLTELRDAIASAPVDVEQVVQPQDSSMLSGSEPVINVEPSIPLDQIFDHPYEEVGRPPLCPPSNHSLNSSKAEGSRSQSFLPAILLRDSGPPVLHKTSTMKFPARAFIPSSQPTEQSVSKRQLSPPSPAASASPSSPMSFLPHSSHSLHNDESYVPSKDASVPPPKRSKPPKTVAENVREKTPVLTASVFTPSKFKRSAKSKHHHKSSKAKIKALAPASSSSEAIRTSGPHSKKRKVVPQQPEEDHSSNRSASPVIEVKSKSVVPSIHQNSSSRRKSKSDRRRHRSHHPVIEKPIAPVSYVNVGSKKKSIKTWAEQISAATPEAESYIALEPPINDRRLSTIPGFPPRVLARFQGLGIETTGDLSSRGVLKADYSALLKFVMTLPEKPKSLNTPEMSYDEIEAWLAEKRLLDL